MIPITYDTWKASEPWSHEEELEEFEPEPDESTYLPMPPRSRLWPAPEIDDQLPF